MRLIILLLLLGCGKPIASQSSEAPREAWIDFDFEGTPPSSIFSQENRKYTLPRSVLDRSGNSRGYIALTFDSGESACYRGWGFIWYNSHSRIDGKCVGAPEDNRNPILSYELGAGEEIAIVCHNCYGSALFRLKGE